MHFSSSWNNLPGQAALDTIFSARKRSTAPAAQAHTQPAGELGARARLLAGTLAVAGLLAREHATGTTCVGGGVGGIVGHSCDEGGACEGKGEKELHGLGWDLV